jgi:O-antigen/teichoic acid export membrane protein
VIGVVFTAVEVGKYSAGYTLGMVIMFFYAPFRAFMHSKATQLWEKGEHFTLRRVLNYSNKYPLLLSIPAVFGFVALYDPILRSVTGQSLQVSVLLIPVIALGYVFHYVGTAYAAVFRFEKKTRYTTYGYGIGAVVNVVGNICLVPLFGIMGAAVMTMVTFLLMMIYFIWKSRSFFDIELEWGYVWKSVVAASIMYGVLHVVEPTVLRLSNLLHVGCSITIGALTYSLVIWISGAISREEIDYFKNLVGVTRTTPAAPS